MTRNFSHGSLGGGGGEVLLILWLFTMASADVRFTPMAQPVPAVKHLESSDGDCSLSVISSAGHVLTARHCLQKCLIQNGTLKLQKSPTGIDYFVLNSAKLGIAECAVKVNGEPEQLTIDATSPGLIARVDEPTFAAMEPQFYSELIARGFTAHGDFVIGHLGSPQTCVALAPSSPAVGEQTFTLGYPGETNRPDGHNSDGAQMYFSAGARASGIEDTQCLRGLLPQAVADAKAHFDEPGALILGVDAVFGSSGSPAFNEQGEVVGVLSNVFRLAAYTGQDADEPEVRFCDHSVKALSVEQIERVLQAEGLELKTYSNCTTNYGLAALLSTFSG